MTSRVFILEHPRRDLDLSSLGEYGEVTYLFNSQRRRASVFEVNSYVLDVQRALEDAGFSEDDYFAVAGSVINVSLAMIALERVGVSSTQLLMFGASTGKYEARELLIGDSNDQQTSRAAS